MLQAIDLLIREACEFLASVTWKVLRTWYLMLGSWRARRIVLILIWAKLGTRAVVMGALVLYDYRCWKRLIFWQERLVNSLGLWFSQGLVFEFTILGEAFLSISPWGSIALDSRPRARIYDRNTGHVRLCNGFTFIPLLLLYEKLWGHGILS